MERTHTMDLDAARDTPSPTRAPASKLPEAARVGFAGQGLQFMVSTGASAETLATRLEASQDAETWGTWSSLPIVERAVNLALTQFGAEIYDWAAEGGRRPFMADVAVGFDVGRVVTRAELDAAHAEGRPPATVATQRFRLQLRTSPNPPGFYVRVAIPLAPLPAVGVAMERIETYEARPDSPQTGGHTLARHVGESLSMAIERLDREPDIRAAGSFHSAAVAEAVVATMVDVHGREIAAWVADTSSTMPFVREVSMARPVGWVITRDELTDARTSDRQPIARAVTGARIVLRRSPEYPDGYYVVTAYPVE